MYVLQINVYLSFWSLYIQNISGSGGIRTHASEETGALNQRLRPLGHATSVQKRQFVSGCISQGRWQVISLTSQKRQALSF